MRPAAACRYAVSSSVADSWTWNVPANAVRGSMPERSRGRRVSSMLTFSCAPSGASAGALPEQPVEDGRRARGQHVPRAHAVLAAVGVRPRDLGVAGLDRA